MAQFRNRDGVVNYPVHHRSEIVNLMLVSSFSLCRRYLDDSFSDVYLVHFVGSHAQARLKHARVRVGSTVGDNISLVELQRVRVVPLLSSLSLP